jgi:hypothetical protein
MKEIIGAVMLVVALWGGTKMIGQVHDAARKAALTKAAQGLPDLPRFHGTVKLRSYRYDNVLNKQNKEQCKSRESEVSTAKNN